WVMSYRQNRGKYTGERPRVTPLRRSCATTPRRSRPGRRSIWGRRRSRRARTEPGSGGEYYRLTVGGSCAPPVTSAEAASPVELPLSRRPPSSEPAWTRQLKGAPPRRAGQAPDSDGTQRSRARRAGRRSGVTRRAERSGAVLGERDGGAE